MIDTAPANRVLTDHQRQLIVSALGAAIADAWRREHQRATETIKEQGVTEVDGRATAGALTPAVAV
jgi:hypothetical protein